jgi:hypothetical protein
MSQQQRHQLGLIAVPSTEPCLQLGTGYQELLTAWEAVHGASSILLLSASALDSLVLAVHVESLVTGQKGVSDTVNK